MTRRKRNEWDRISAAPWPSWTKSMAANIQVIKDYPDPAAMLETIEQLGFSDDAELRSYAEAGDRVLVVARLMELTILRAPKWVAATRASLASLNRSAKRTALNKADAAAVRADALQRFDRAMWAGGFTAQADGLRACWPNDKAMRDRVRKWLKVRTD